MFLTILDDLVSFPGDLFDQLSEAVFEILGSTIPAILDDSFTILKSSLAQLHVLHSLLELQLANNDLLIENFDALGDALHFVRVVLAGGDTLYAEETIVAG